MKTTTTFLVLAFAMFVSSAQGQGLVINEILASNNNANTDEDGDHQDWLELYNGTTDAVSLNGYGLTDNPSLPFKWVFPDYTMQPGEHLLVWCSDKNRTNPAAPLHTNWKISNEGETLRLSQPSGTIVDEIPPVVLGSDVSYGRTVSGSPDFTIFLQPTPGAPNSVLPPSESLAAPVFSVASGFFSQPFSVSITHPEPGVTILYTLDGSEPNPANIGGKTYSYKNQYPEFPGDPFGELLPGSYQTLTYDQPLEVQDRSEQPNDVSWISTTLHQIPYYLPVSPVKKATVIRALAIKNGYNPSPVVTQNYFFSPSAHTLPVISINLDEDLFFDYEKGIHVAGKDFDDWRLANPDAAYFDSNNNYLRSGDATEARANFSFFKDGQLQLNQDVGIRINGGFSRFYPNKSLRIYARSEFGASELEYPFFTRLNYNSYKTLVLRNSGNDVNKTYFRDAFIQRACGHMNLATQGYEPAVVYLNSEYWGMLNFCERYDKHYFKRVFGIETDQLDFLEMNGTIVQEGDNLHYLDMLSYLESHDLSDDSNYDHIKTQLDPENFTDFYIANIYANNIDWPHNNNECWRKHTDSFQSEAPYGQDGRWRWVLKDTDFGFGNLDTPDTYTNNTLAFASSTGGDPSTNPEWSTFLFRKMLENSGYRTYFINRFADMINTAFVPERLNGLIAEMAAGIAGEIMAHGQRWQSIHSLGQWNDNIGVMTEFANQRPEYQRTHIREKFGLEANITATVNVSGAEQGYVQINTIAINPDTPGVPQNAYPWSGVYFKNVPVRLKAVAMEGYAFSYWSGSVESFEAEITITPDADFSVTAHFVSTAAINDRVPVYFWALDYSLPNLSLLTSIDASYEQSGNAKLHYISCLEGYPFSWGHADWGKAALAKIENPTPINYLPEANDELAYPDANIMGIMVTQPFQSATAENTLVFDLPTTGYKNMVAAFAAKNQNAAESIVLDYSVSPDAPIWVTTGLPVTTLPLNAEYTLYTADFTAIASVNENPDFKLRLRFAGPDLMQTNGGRVFFNNVSLTGSPLQPLAVAKFNPAAFELFPNPFSERIFIRHSFASARYEVFSMDGKLLQSGAVAPEIDLSGLSAGLYLLRLSADGKTETKKVLKQ